jgi:hypothetical protein
MALGINGVQDSRALLGLGLEQKSWLLVPGTSDYVTGGYVVSAQNVGLGHIQSAWVSGLNATAIATWEFVPVFAFAQLSTSSAGESGYSQFLLYAYVLSTGAQAASGANLTGSIVQVTVQGY